MLGAPEVPPHRAAHDPPQVRARRRGRSSGFSPVGPAAAGLPADDSARTPAATQTSDSTSAHAPAGFTKLTARAKDVARLAGRSLGVASRMMNAGLVLGTANFSGQGGLSLAPPLAQQQQFMEE